MKTSLFFIFLLLASLISLGQTSFLVVQLKGSGYYSRSNTRIPLKIGSSLTSDDEVMLKEKSMFTLVCNNYGTTTLQSGNAIKKISLHSYVDSCRNNKNTSTTGYMKYIWRALTTRPVNDESEEGSDNEVAGAITREVGVVPIAGYESIPGLIRFFKRNFAVKWTVLDNSCKLEIAIFSMNDSVIPILKFPVKNKFQIVDLKKNLPSGLEKINWTILIDGKVQLGRKIIEFTSGDSIRSQLNEQDTGLSNTEKYFLKGYFLEREHYYGEADYYYQLTLHNAPDNSFFRTSKTILESKFDFPPY
jgi:hypothetical protein